MVRSIFFFLLNSCSKNTYTLLSVQKLKKIIINKPVRKTDFFALVRKINFSALVRKINFSAPVGKIHLLALVRKLIFPHLCVKLRFSHSCVKLLDFCYTRFGYTVCSKNLFRPSSASIGNE